MRWCSAVSSYFPHFLQVGWLIKKDFHPLHVFASVTMTCYHFDNMILVSPLWVRSYQSWRRSILLNHFAHLVYGLECSWCSPFLFPCWRLVRASSHCCKHTTLSKGLFYVSWMGNQQLGEPSGSFWANPAPSQPAALQNNNQTKHILL